MSKVAADRAPARASRRAAAPAGASLGPNDWLQAALRMLAGHNIDAIRIDVLAKALNVTRGSFYWHFRDRDDFLQRLLVCWRDATTEDVISRFEHREMAPAELIHDLLSLPFRGMAAREAAAVELAIRAWARSDPKARQALDIVDAHRLSYIAQCLSALGHLSIPESRRRAFVLYGYLVAESLLQHHGSDTQRKERRAWVEQCVLARG